jgi:hypothetical protein
VTPRSQPPHLGDVDSPGPFVDDMDAPYRSESLEEREWMRALLTRRRSGEATR